MPPPQMVPDIFGAGVFEEDFKRILAVMPNESDKEKSAREHMQGIMSQITAGPRDPVMIEELKIYLTEMDRRRGTDWRVLFPWLDQDWMA